MSGQELLAQVFDTDTAAEATTDDCIELLDGALRLGVVMDSELMDAVETWLYQQWEEPVLVASVWPLAPRVGLLVNGCDERDDDCWIASYLLIHQVPSYLRMDAHIVEMPRKEFAVPNDDRQFIECQKHQAVGANQIGVPTTPVPLSAPEQRRENAARKMLADAIAATKRAIERLPAAKPDVAALVVETIAANKEAFAKVMVPQPEPAVIGDPQKYAVTIAELLPSLIHRTSDGRWFLKGHRIHYRLDVEGRTIKWSSRGLHPKKWDRFEGTVMLVNAVVVD